MFRLIFAVSLLLFSSVSFAQDVSKSSSIKIHGRIVSIADNRLEINVDGFPKQIYNRDLSHHLLYEPMHFHFYNSAKSQEKFITNDLKITSETIDSIAWVAKSSSANLEMIVKGKILSNGLVNYKVKIVALKSITMSAINFHIPFEKSGSKYLVGLGQKTYERPDTVKWIVSNWNKIKPSVWIGDKELGLYFRIKETSDWLKNNNGAMQINIKGSSMLTDVYTSKVILNEANELNLDFNLILSLQSSEHTKLSLGKQFKLSEKLGKKLSKNK